MSMPSSARSSTTTTRTQRLAAGTTGASFRETPASQAGSLTDGVRLHANHPVPNKHDDSRPVIMPWVGYGTYRLGKNQSRQCTLQALECGYRCIDTAFIYGGETTETQVGEAIRTALKNGKTLQSRKDLFVITKQWRKYHGYEPTLSCLHKSLQRLQLEYIDLWLMHWPGPAYSTVHRKKEVLGREDGAWQYSKVKKEDMPRVRAETWRAMEDSLKSGTTRAIGVSNFSIGHLETLKKTATVWPPAVNQVECHALYPQDELLAYCQTEGIVVQAYAALGGQDATKKQWKALLDGEKLLTAPAVIRVATELGVTPAQVLLRWALERNCAVTPKTSNPKRMVENSQIFGFCLSTDQKEALDSLKVEGQEGRLCWRTDPLRLLDFD